MPLESSHADPRRNRLKTVLGVAASVLIAGIAAYVLFRTFQRISFADVLRNVRAVPSETLLLAVACAVVHSQRLPPMRSSWCVTSSTASAEPDQS